MKHWVLVLAILLAACGGGSGSNSDTSSTPTAPTNPTEPTTPTAPTTPPATPAENGWLTFSPNSVDVERFEGDVASFVVTATSSKTIDEQLNVRVEATDAFAGPYVSVSTRDPLKFDVTLKTATAWAAGIYSGQFKVQLCRDSAYQCNSPYPGSPWYVPYRIKIIAPTSNLTALKPLDGATVWNNAFGNAANTNFVNTTAKLNPAGFSMRWRTMVGGSSYMATDGAHVAVALGVPYDTLRVLNEQDGALAWATDSSYSSGRAIALAQGRVFVGAETAFDLATGQPFPLSSSGKSRSGSPTADDSSVYFPSSYSYLPVLRLDASSGNDRWMLSPTTSARAHGGFSRLAVDSSFVYEYGVDEKYTPPYGPQWQYSLNLYRVADGALAASIPDEASPVTESAFPYTPVLDGNGHVIAARFEVVGGTFSSYSIDEQKLIWSVRDGFRSLPSVVGSTFYVITTPFPQDPGDNIVFQARATDSGDLIWETPLPETNDGWHEVVTVGNLVFVSGSATYAIDRDSHKIVWKFPANGKLAVSPNGTLYIASNGGGDSGRGIVTAVNLR